MVKHPHEPFPWLRRRFGGTEYLSPEYYAELLRPYRFAGTSDLDVFKTCLAEMHGVSPKRVLELGSGPGRATDIYLNAFRDRSRVLELLDQSAQMLDASMRKYGLRDDIKYLHSDIVRYILHAPDRYDLVFSLWSFSHSVHQTLFAEGEIAGRTIVKDSISKLCQRNLNRGGRLFLIHFDALSQEQEISLSIRRLKYPFFRPGHQSPSKEILDETLTRLSAEGIVRYDVKHLTGDQITFGSVEEALEVFFNFHMECEFNDRSDIARLVGSVREKLERLRNSDNTLHIKPGCFIYRVDRVSS